MTTQRPLRWTAASLAALCCTAGGCSAAFSFPDEAPERSAAACSDGVDNDFDGLEDCDDAEDCAGFCPEREANRCGDGVDNDGDGFTDAADPSCWPVAGSAPEAERCAVQGAMLDEPFDFAIDPETGDTGFAQPWDSWADPGVAIEFQGLSWVGRPPGREQRSDTALMLSPSPSQGLGTTGVRLARELSGSWSELEIDFDVSMISDGEVALLLVPSSSAPKGQAPLANAELMAITVRGSPTERTVEVAVGERRVRETFAAPELCDSGFCGDGMQRFSLRMRDGALVGRFAGRDLPPLDAAELGDGSPRLRVFLTARGGSLFEGYVDDLHAGFAPTSPCGFFSPQMPRGAPTECALPPGKELIGGAVALARGPDGARCALVTYGGGIAGSSLHSYRSDDGDRFQRGLRGERDAPPAVGQLPSADPEGRQHALLGASLVWDADAARWVAAATYRGLGTPVGIVVTSAEVEGGPVWLQRYHSEDCVDWTATSPRSELPEDAEAPSIVIEDDGEPGIYFTRAPNDDVGRTLWLAHDDGTRSAVAELDRALHVDAPVTLSRVGGDYLLVHPLDGRADAPGLGVTVSDDGLESFRSAGELPLLEPSSTVGFDDIALLSGSLVWDADGGRLLYGARGTSPGGTPVSAAGTARLRPAGHDSEPDAEPADAGTAAPPEPAPIDDASTWRLEVWPPDEEATVAPFVYADGAEITVGTAFPGPQTGIQAARQVWLTRPVTAGDTGGDFELSFEWLVSPSEGGCDAVVGVRHGSPLLDPTMDLDQADALVAQNLGAYVLLRQEGNGGQLVLRPVTSLVESLGFLPTQGTPPHASLPIDRGSYQRVVLQRRAGALRLTRQRDTACGPLEHSVELAYQGALTELDRLVVGIPWECLFTPGQERERFVVRNLRLRPLRNVDDCGVAVCGSGAEAVCVDPEDSPEHCGGCGQVCTANERCVDGACECPYAPGSCGGCGVDPCGDGSCVFGACSVDVGEACADATEVPPEGGTATFHYSDRREGADHAFCEDAIDTGAADLGISAMLTRDAVFRWTAPRSQRVHLTAGPYPAALAVTDDPGCAGARCASVPNVGADSALDFDATEGTTYFILVGEVTAGDGLMPPVLAPLGPTAATLTLIPEPP